MQRLHAAQHGVQLRKSIARACTIINEHDKKINSENSPKLGFERSCKIMNTNKPENRSLLNFAVLEFVLSIPFWGWVALAHAGVVPDFQMLNAAWSLTPMMAASILVYREHGAA